MYSSSQKGERKGEKSEKASHVQYMYIYNLACVCVRAQKVKERCVYATTCHHHPVHGSTHPGNYVSVTQKPES